MLTIVCGEDSPTSRNYFLSLKKKYLADNCEVKNITSEELTEIHRWLADTPSLFNKKRVFFIENLNRKINKKTNLKYVSILEKLIKDKEIMVIDWENGLTGRELKISQGIIIKEFKLPQNIFQLLDACFPSNLKKFLNIFNSLPEDIEDPFIFTMLHRHIKKLLLVKNKINPPKLAGWQLRKLELQTKFWSTDKLISFYDALYRLDISIKTSKSPYSLRQSLNLLVCYYL